jgi:hypothetical protein
MIVSGTIQFILTLGSGDIRGYFSHLFRVFRFITLFRSDAAINIRDVCRTPHGCAFAGCSWMSLCWMLMDEPSLDAHG